MTIQKEFVGKNVEMAVEEACKALDLPKDKLHYKVVSHGSTGIFGLVGVRKARIAVRLSVAGPVANDPCDADVEETPKVAEPIRLTAEQAEQPVPDDDPISSGMPETENTESGGRPSHGGPDELGTEALRKITDAITENAKIAIAEQDGRIRFQITGGNAALLIGKRGQTLDAIQYIVEKIVNKKNPNRIRVHVDVENYLENRRTNLRELALKMAQKTKKTGKPSTLGQMNANDRRIIHLALKEDRQVRTQSVGDGFLRKLVIFPKKNAYRKNRGS